MPQGAQAITGSGKEVMETVLDVTQIQSILPHRYPFLLVDRIIEYEPHKRVVGIKNVTLNEPFFQGHFPGAPVMPGVLIIEAMAQAGALLVMREIEGPDRKLPFFSAIKDGRFRHPVVPGDTLVLEVTALRVGSRVQRMRGVAKVDGKMVAEAELTCVIVEREERQNKSSQ
jgi:beta-hydroxyacyl-ACP dehydratase FabZ